MVPQSLVAEAGRQNAQLGLIWHLPCSPECAHCTHQDELWALEMLEPGPQQFLLLQQSCCSAAAITFPTPQAAPANSATRSFTPRPASPSLLHVFCGMCIGKKEKLHVPKMPLGRVWEMVQQNSKFTTRFRYVSIVQEEDAEWLFISHKHILLGKQFHRL